MKKLIDIVGIWNLLPQRPPKLLVDGVLSYEPNKSLVATRYLRASNPVFEGHFPKLALMPGVYIVEALAQAGTLLWTLDKRQNLWDKVFRRKAEPKTLVLISEQQIRFKKPVFPETLLLLAVTIEEKTADTLKLKVQAQDETGSEVFATGTLTLMLYSNDPLSILAKNEPQWVEEYTAVELV